MRVAHVVPDVAVSELESAYTYQVPEGLRVERGDAVLVPFGNRTVVGYVSAVEDIQEPTEYKLKPLQERIDGISLPENLLQLLDYLADEFAATPGAAIAAAMPPGIRTRLTTYFEGEGEGSTPAQVAILAALQRRGRLSEKALRAVTGFSDTGLRALLAEGKVTKSAGLPADRRRSSDAFLIADEHDAKAFLAGDGAKRPAQAQCIAALLEAPQSGMSLAEIALLAGVSDATVRALIDDGLLKATPPSEQQGSAAEMHRLNADQSRAVSQLSKAIQGGGCRKFLLFGITGSGKTEVYMRAIDAALAQGKQALFLVPEIALTAQVVGLLRSRFGPSVAIMHSALASGERLRNWRRAATGDAPVVVGARSAIFAPLTNLGVIILDEEHDTSYKQESMPRYDVRALAEKRAEIEGCTLVSGSATPSVETFFRAESGEFELLRLPKRAAASALPQVHIEDLRETYKSKKPTALSERLRKELAINAQIGEQSMLFINRRAFARSLLCRDCGFTPQCPRCSVALTFHSKPVHLRCHHCDHRQKAFDRCPSCASLRIRPLGIGTQKVEEHVKKEFPGMRVERLDRDVASRKGAVEAIFARVRSGETQTLIGTQMIAKGLDFENVTLVGVIAADISLSIPDYRCTERTFQLITQVSGRAGRKKPGRVIVQTFAPDHPSIKLAAAQDYEAFYSEEIAERRDARYPPFVRLVNIVASGPDREAVRVTAERVKETLQEKLEDATIYGPAECVLAKLSGNWRWHVLIKLPTHFRMKAFPRSRDLPAEDGVSVLVDVNPGSLM